MEIKSFGQALRHLREKKGLSYVEVADLTRSDKKRVKAWEADSPPPPNTLQLKALYSCFPPLKHYTHLLPRATVAALNFKLDKAVAEANGAAARVLATSSRTVGTRLEAKEAGQAALDRELGWLPPIDSKPLPAADAAPLPKPKTFGEALRQARVREGLAQAELAELVGVVLRAVQHWESDGASPVKENLDKLHSLLPALRAFPPVITPRHESAKPVGAANNYPDDIAPRGSAWRGRVIDALEKSGDEVAGAVFAVRRLVDLQETSARQVAEYLNKLIDWARSVKTALPIHVVEHERMYPGTNGTPLERVLGAANVPVDAPTAQPDYGWRRCATLGGKGHLWNPAPGAVPPKSTDGLPEVTCPHHAKAAQPVPDLPGAIGAGARYGAAMVELARAAMIRRGAEAFFEEAKLGEEIAQEELAKAKSALDGAADKEATDAA